ncbi:MAG TPA: condensation domain-containing protein, partial [Ktedonobacteraceae bacterium]|nr:condensation domain-containing protein [Ktedonobacteraceae bacterium]
MTTSTIDNMISDETIYVFPVSFSQEGLWLHDQLEPESAIYNIPVAIRLKRLLDVEILERSLNAIVQRHEALRTTFRLMKGQPVQVIAPTLTIPLSVVNLRDFHAAEREIEALRLATEEARRPFDLTLGPLVRACVVHLGGDEDMLLLTMHHIIFDSWSLDVLYRELVTMYEAFSIGQPSPLQELSVQYKDFAALQREALQGDSLTEHLAYWQQQLAGSPSGLELPTDRPRSPIPASQGSTYCVTLSRALTGALKELSRQEGVTLYMTLVATFQTLLYRYTGQDDLLIVNLTTCRVQPET